jgi:tetratricopeptide (TPR) repeat protein
MIGLFALVAAAASAPATVPDPHKLIGGAAQAIDSGRFVQARIMTGRAMSLGLRGAEVDRVLADLAFGEGRYAEAVIRYDALLLSNPANASLLERAAIAALRLGDLVHARPLIVRATTADGASWRAWNARGVVADFERNWPDADAAYARALHLQPRRADVINNRGWSQLLRGDWIEAIADFEQAAALDPASARIRNNLELARAALSADLPRRRDGELDEDWAARLNDAGVAAEILGDRRRAIAAFTRALEASGRWYTRAANNLSAATASK